MPFVKPRVIVLALALVTVLTGAALAATLHTETAHRGDTVATFTYRGSPPSVSGARLTITKAGQLRYDQPVHSAQCGSSCIPGSFRGPSVKVLALEAVSAPDVVLELFSNGASCCFVDQVFSYDPGTQTYSKSERNFASAGAAIERLRPRHRLVFVSADANFKYEFTDGADSGEPIQIWRFQSRHFHDVTRSYPARVKADAARWFGLFTHHYANGEGFVAAWAADEELLGHDKLVQATLSAAAKAHHLHAGHYPGPTGHAFVLALNRLLHKLGYRG